MSPSTTFTSADDIIALPAPVLTPLRCCCRCCCDRCADACRRYKPRADGKPTVALVSLRDCQHFMYMFRSVVAAVVVSIRVQYQRIIAASDLCVARHSAMLRLCGFPGEPVSILYTSKYMFRSVVAAVVVNIRIQQYQRNAAASGLFVVRLTVAQCCCRRLCGTMSKGELFC